MADTVYPSALAAFLQGQIDLSAVNVKVVLIDSADYTYNAAHDNLDDVAGAARVATSGNLASKTFTAGTFDAADLSISGVTGDSIEAAIVYVDTGTESTSKLLCYLDGLSLTPNGGSVNLQFNASGIFTI